MLQEGYRVRSVVNETGQKTKWDSFWKYFRSTWIERYDSSLWNVRAMKDSGVDAVNRTNNPLEKYYRDFTAKFSSHHPTILAFVEVTKRDACDYVARIDDIKHGRQQAPNHSSDAPGTVPDGYIEFLQTL